MDIAAFDCWRARYDRMTYWQQVDFYNDVERDHSCQKAFDALAFGGLLAHAAGQLGPFMVLEIGGWKGELAAAMLEQVPEIRSWWNYEICEAALEKTACTSARYHGLFPSDFVWRTVMMEAEVFVAAHLIEHIKRDHLDKLFARLPETVRYVALEAPIQLAGEGITWDGYHGTHILEVGWLQVGLMLEEHGFSQMGPLASGHFRAFERAP